MTPKGLWQKPRPSSVMSDTEASEESGSYRVIGPVIDSTLLSKEVRRYIPHFPFPMPVESLVSWLRKLIVSDSPQNIDPDDVLRSPKSEFIQFQPSRGEVSGFHRIVILRPGEGDIGRALHVAASLDTQCAENIISSGMWDMLKERNSDMELELGPCNKEILPLESRPIKVLGIARGMKWYFKRGPKTYTDDFLVIDMKDFEMLIGWKTIKAKNLLICGEDLPQD